MWRCLESDDLVVNLRPVFLNLGLVSGCVSLNLPWASRSILLCVCVSFSTVNQVVSAEMLHVHGSLFCNDTRVTNCTVNNTTYHCKTCDHKHSKSYCTVVLILLRVWLATQNYFFFFFYVTEFSRFIDTDILVPHEPVVQFRRFFCFQSRLITTCFVVDGESGIPSQKSIDKSRVGTNYTLDLRDNNPTVIYTGEAEHKESNQRLNTCTLRVKPRLTLPRNGKSLPA